MSAQRLIAAACFGILGAAIYFGLFIFCVGGGAVLGAPLVTEGVMWLLRFPLLYLMPIVPLRLFGFDSLNVLVISNTVLWGIGVAAFAYKWRTRNK
jgi:hypothetical protein